MFFLPPNSLLKDNRERIMSLSLSNEVNQIHPLSTLLVEQTKGSPSLLTSIMELGKGASLHIHPASIMESDNNTNLLTQPAVVG